MEICIVKYGNVLTSSHICEKTVTLHLLMQVSQTYPFAFLFSDLLFSSKAFPLQHHHNHIYWKIIGLKLQRLFPVNQSYTTQFKTS